MEEVADDTVESSAPTSVEESEDPSTSSAVASTEESSEEPTTPTVETATPEQLASIISGYEERWREVLDDEDRCQDLILTMGGDDLPANIEGLSCLLKVESLTLTASSASMKLQKLVAPPSMTSLVIDTLNVLDRVAAIDLKPACMPEDSDRPTEDCFLELLKTGLVYSDLRSILGQWQPYI